jgi:hypothetical protein
MVNCERFVELYVQRYRVLKFDGQNQTEAKVGWSKMVFFLNLMKHIKTLSNRHDWSYRHTFIEKHRRVDVHYQKQFYLIASANEFSSIGLIALDDSRHSRPHHYPDSALEPELEPVSLLFCGQRQSQNATDMPSTSRGSPFLLLSNSLHEPSPHLG